MGMFFPRIQWFAISSLISIFKKNPIHGGTIGLATGLSHRHKKKVGMDQFSLS